MAGFTEYWGVITWIMATVFVLGDMYRRVETARKAVNILFDKVDKLEISVARHGGDVESLRETLRRIENSMASNVIRTDQIYAILTKQGN